jgi:alpha-galactosidase
MAMPRHATHSPRAAPPATSAASLVLLLAAAATAPRPAAAINNGLGRTPLMGWSTWCTEGGCSRDVCSEGELQSVAQALIDTGLQRLGWTTIAMDDCWSAWNRSASGELQPDPTRFPSGMRALTDWLHDRGFLAGTYISLGYETCHADPAGRPITGSYPHFELDAATLVTQWGFDYVKGDWCKPGSLDIGNTTTWMAAALNATGVPNRFSFHGFPGFPWTMASGNYARVFEDHHDTWTSGNTELAGTGDIIGLLALTNASAYAGCGQPAAYGGGCWFPDLDFLMTGGQGCADARPGGHCPGQMDAEYRTEFTFWALGSSVLLLATDPRNLTAVMRQALFNTELIAVNQDGTPGVVLRAALPCGSGGGLTQPCQLWHRTNSTGAHFVVVYNPNNATTAGGVAFTFAQAAASLPADAPVAARDLWAHADLGSFTGGMGVGDLGPHEARALQLVPVGAAVVAGGGAPPLPHSH